ncbi:MAG: hypothetical protein ACK5KM_15870, partial [Hyphomicrobiaceae bacterium]
MSLNAIPIRQSCYLAIAVAGFMLSPSLAAADDTTFARKANLTCRQILNDRPARVLQDGATAGVKVLAAFMRRSSLADDERAELRSAILARRNEFQRSRQALASLVPPAALSADWQTLIDYVAGE